VFHGSFDLHEIFESLFMLQILLISLYRFCLCASYTLFLVTLPLSLRFCFVLSCLATEPKYVYFYLNFEIVVIPMNLVALLGIPIVD
jgi:hypothetical protein